MSRNADPDKRGADIYRFNAIKYNPDLDQIAFSSPELNKIFIIDHSTTTKEAAANKGGRWRKGGDILYRWGNPQNYHRGDSLDQQLHYQHDIRWIDKGEAGAGHLTVFNNNSSRSNKTFFDESDSKTDSVDYSAIYEVISPVDSKGAYILEKGNPTALVNQYWCIRPQTRFLSGAAIYPARIACPMAILLFVKERRDAFLRLQKMAK